jgi:hypothetical protein
MARFWKYRVLTATVLTAVVALPGCTADQKARAYAGDDRDEWQQPERDFLIFEVPD